MSPQIRARTEEAKDEKRRSILAAAGELFSRSPYEKITVEAVALAAGVSKGTVFVYFPTKEELFLGVAETLFSDFFENLQSGLAVQPPRDREALKRLILDAVGSHPAWLTMIPLLDVIIERNVREESLIRFKGYLLEEMTRIGAGLDELCPYLGRTGGGARFLFWLYGIVAGFLHLSDPGEAARNAIETGGMDPFRFDFLTEFERFLTLFLEGLDR